MPLANSGTSILIFRTVNVERMAGVVGACRTRWPSASLVVLSSPNRRAEMLADPRVAEVLDLPFGPDGFPPRVDLGRRVDAVVVPLGNQRGSGYGNVLDAARRCVARDCFVMPYAASLTRVSRWWLWRTVAAEQALLAVSYPLARLAALLLLPRT